MPTLLLNATLQSLQFISVLRLLVSPRKCFEGRFDLRFRKTWVSVRGWREEADKGDQLVRDDEDENQSDGRGSRPDTESG